ncbi:hypothetical protein EYF80_036336 [Liparis tanakae]|uniref:Uncharacterized protein n=1 Tax=Liparis tanakae TaxID=230148 RepID=A0A4Z2GIZ9_9TELE|nr:hypothetical protein EYF80_036336 [Liparis tanakae]
MDANCVVRLTAKTEFDEDDSWSLFNTQFLHRVGVVACFWSRSSTPLPVSFEVVQNTRTRTPRNHG